MDQAIRRNEKEYLTRRSLETAQWLIEEASKPQSKRDRENEEDRQAEYHNEIHERRMDRSVIPWMERIPRETLFSILQNLGSRDLATFSTTGHMQSNVSRDVRMHTYLSSDNPLATFLISHGQDDFDWYISGLMKQCGIEMGREEQYVEENTGKALMVFVAAWSRRFTRHRRDLGIPPPLLAFLLKVQIYLRSWVYRPAVKDIVVACECLAAMIGLRRFHVYSNWSNDDFSRIYYGRGGNDQFADYVFYDPTERDIWPFQDNGWTVYNRAEARLLTLGFYNEHFSATRTGTALTKKLSRTLIFGLFVNQIEQTRVFKGVHLLPLTFALFTFVRSFIFSSLHSEFFSPRVYDSKLLWASEFKIGLDGPMRSVVQFQLSENGLELLGSSTEFSGHVAQWTSLVDAYEIVCMIADRHNIYIIYYFHKQLIEYRDEHPLSRELVSRVLDDIQAKYGSIFHRPAVRHGANHIFFRFDELENMYNLMRDGRYARDGPLGVFYTDRSWGQVKAHRLPLPEFIEDRVRLPAVRPFHVVLLAALETLILKSSVPNTPEYREFGDKLVTILFVLTFFSEMSSARGSSLNYLVDWNEPRFIGADSVIHGQIEFICATILALIIYAINTPNADEYPLCAQMVFIAGLSLAVGRPLFGVTREGIQDLLKDVAGGVPYLARKLLKRRESLPVDRTNAYPPV